MMTCQNKEQVECVDAIGDCPTLWLPASLQPKQSALGMSPTAHLAAKFELIQQQYGGAAYVIQFWWPPENFDIR